MRRFAFPSTAAVRALAPALCLAILAGCNSMPAIPGISAKPATAGTAGTPSASAPASTVAPAPSGLAEGIALYNKGDYNGAIRRLSQSDVSGPAAPRATQTAALKYSAFSYCLTARQAQCRQQFDKALKIDPAFDLEAGEHGHPLWEPVFVKARKGLK